MLLVLFFIFFSNALLLLEFLLLYLEFKTSCSLIEIIAV